MPNKEIKALNALKFLCAIMVVWIHIPLVMPNPINRIAVPIFFMISGYFLVNPDGTIPPKRITKILKKIFTLTLSVNLIYYTYRVIVLHHYTVPILHTLLVGDALNGAMWYMNAYLQALIIIWIIVKLKATKFLPWFAILGLVLNLILGSYYWIFWDNQPKLILEGHAIPFALHRNFFTIALPCIVIGCWLRMKDRPIKFSKLFISAIILIVGNLIEAIFRLLRGGGTGDIGLLTIPLATIVFLIALNIKSEMRIISYLANLGRNYSTNIFLFHLLISGILLGIAARLPLIVPDKKYWMLPVVIIVVIFLTKIYYSGKSKLLNNDKKNMPSK